MNRGLFPALLFVALLVSGETPDARADASEVTVADQFGIA